MIKPVQILKNAKNNLSVPVVTEKKITKNSELSIKYIKKLRKLLYINLSLFVLLLIGWKWWFQYRLGYNHWQSIEYILELNNYKLIVLVLGGLNFVTILWFNKLYSSMQMSEAKVYFQKKRKLFIRVYWLATLLYINLMAYGLSIFKTEILLIAAVITTFLVLFIKYVAVYLYKHYKYQFTYYQILIFTINLNFIGMLFIRDFKLIANIIFIFAGILMLMGTFKNVEYMKEKFNNDDFYNEKDAEVEAYDNAYMITIEILYLYTEIVDLLSGDDK